MRIFWGTLIALAAALGCTDGGSSSSDGAQGLSSSGSSPAASHPCSPLEAVTEPIALDNVVGAGRHADGTIYVLDRGQPDYRAFVSEGSVLQRKKVAGSGSNGDSEVVATVSDPNAPFALKVESANGVAKRMGVFRGELNDKSFEIGEKGDVLELVDATVYGGLTVENIPGGAVVEFAASTTDGERIIVTQPAVDGTYEDYKVFFGAPPTLLERKLVSASGGGSYYFTFLVDGAEVTAVFRTPRHYLPPELQTGSTTKPLTMFAADAGPPTAGLEFLCL